MNSQIRAIGEQVDRSVRQAVRALRFWRPGSYSGHFRTRYRDFAYSYRVRFGYSMGGGSGSGTFQPRHAANPGVMHQRRTPIAAPLRLAPFG